MIRRLLLVLLAISVVAVPGRGKERAWVGPDLWHPRSLSRASVAGFAPVLLPGGEEQVLVFCGIDADGRSSFWLTDGSAEGTERVARPWPDSSWPLWGPVSHDGAAWMMAGTVEDGVGLYRTGGTAAGTSIALSPDPAVLLGGRLTVWNDRLWFAGPAEGLDGSTIWSSDGTPEGSGPVRSADPPRLVDWNIETLAFPAGDLLYFFARTESEGKELWRTDGTEEGTVLLRDIRQGPEDHLPDGSWLWPEGALARSGGGGLFFAADDGDSGLEPWWTDGTPEGTVLLADLNPGPGSSTPRFLGELAGWFYLVAADGSGVTGLWRTDGTGAGATKVFDFTAEMGAPPCVVALGVLGEHLLLSVTEDAASPRLWRSDGTAEGTVPLATLRRGGTDDHPVGGFQVHGTTGLATFRTSWGDWPDRFWMTDGTAEGTLPVSDATQPLLWRGRLLWADANGNLQGSAPGALGRSSSDLDEDGDGFSTELEDALGSRWWDGGSTPPGTESGGAPGMLEIRDARFSVTGWRLAKDALRLDAGLPVPAGFEPEGAAITVDAGGVIRSFDLDRRGRGRSGDARLRLRLRRRGGEVREDPAARLRFTVRRGSLMEALADEGVWEPTPVEAKPLDLPVTVLRNGRPFRGRAPLLWTVRDYGIGGAVLDRISASSR